MKIAVRLPFIKDSIKDRLNAVAKGYNYEISYLPEHEPTLAEVKDFNILFGKFPVEHFSSMKELKWYQSPSAGVDNLVGPGIFSNPDVIITNGSGAYGVTIAEYQIMMLLMLMRNAQGYVYGQRDANWTNLGDVRSIYGSTIVVLGVGDLGSQFAKRATAMGANVIGVRRSGNKLEDGFKEMFSISELDQVLPRADVVALCLPGTGETVGVLTAERISMLKPSALVLNVGRGSAIDQDALCDALNQGKIGGAALDVTVPEPLPKGHKLWSAKNTLITPHVSGNYSLGHTCDVLIDIFEENLVRFAQGKELKNIVDIKLGY